MAKEKLDLSNDIQASGSRNITAIIGVCIMNVVLVLAYLLEVVKGTRTIGSYLVLAVLLVWPCIASIITYMKHKDAKAIRYICGIGFLVFYAIIMMTATTDLTFCYVLVIFSIMLVFVDFKFLMMLSCCAMVVNVAVVIKKAVTTGLGAVDISNAEITLACVLMTSIFALMAVNKIDKINKANVDKSNKEKEQADQLLQTTLAVADSITENIEVAVKETEILNGAINATQHSMEDLTSGTNDTVQAIMEQQKSTGEIDGYIKGVEASTLQIVEELNSAEDNLKVSHEVMDNLLEQVKVSENSSAVVTKEMEGLKDNADKMQSIIALIGSVAEQTALLSLNASIEAARAGEAGRGFAVVAGEISNLAAQTNTATEDINKLIESITRSIAEVTTAMEALLESNRYQNEYVNDTAKNFDKIQSSTRAISGQADQLKQAVQDVAVANTRVVESIDNVSAVTEEVTASANETLNSCNMNLESIEKVMQVMEKLGEEAKRLQQN